MIRPHVFGRDRHRPHHRLLVHVHARQHRRVVGDAHSILQPRQRIRDVALVDDAVGVAVDVRVVADGDVVAEVDPAAVVEQRVPMHHDVVADFHVVAKRKFYVLKGFEVLAAALEDVRRQQSPELHAQLHVLAADHGAIE